MRRQRTGTLKRLAALLALKHLFDIMDSSGGYRRESIVSNLKEKERKSI